MIVATCLGCGVGMLTISEPLSLLCDRCFMLAISEPLSLLCDRCFFRTVAKIWAKQIADGDVNEEALRRAAQAKDDGP